MSTFSVSFSGGACRACSMTMGILRSLYKNKLIGRVNYLSSVSGSSWITTIISYTDDDIELLLGFNNKDKRTIDVMTKIDIDVSSRQSFKETTTNLVNRYITKGFTMTNKPRREWPELLIGSSYDSKGKYYHVEYSSSQTTVFPNNKIYNKPDLEVMIASSSCVYSFNSYKHTFSSSSDTTEYNLHDGCFTDHLAISPLLRRKEPKIFALLSTGFKDGKINLNCLHSYKDIVNVDDLNLIIDNLRLKIEKDGKDEIAYVRRNVRILDNDQFGHKAYTVELILLVPTRVSSFYNTLPKTPYLRNFPNYSVAFENAPDILALTYVQVYSNVLFVEWCLDMIIENERDFFS